MELKWKYWTELEIQKFGKMLTNTQNSHEFSFFPILIDTINFEKIN